MKPLLVALVIMVLAGFAWWAINEFYLDSSKEAHGQGDQVAQMTSSVVGLVLDTSGNPVTGARVLVSGPYRATEGATQYFAQTSDKGAYWVFLPIDGDYDINVEAEGFVPALLVGHPAQVVGKAPVVTGHTKVPDIVLKREAQFLPARGPNAYVYGKGVEEDEVCRVLLSHGIISSCEEINATVAVTESGAGWTTYVRDGQAISTRPINYTNEQFWEVTFKEPRTDGLERVLVQRVCGNITAPKGEEFPQQIRVVPTSTPIVVSTPTPTPTPLFFPTATPTSPVPPSTATPTATLPSGVTPSPTP
ncbi:carboxypeptidase regulatory-like domain-containing protein, partial [Candidatus Curtissbacteria bacterium]|nr:carboxypeptidase regulatory-like domain-containing protein [Candidatus Curtissbacteria bacterium]